MRINCLKFNDSHSTHFIRMKVVYWIYKLFRSFLNWLHEKDVNWVFIYYFNLKLNRLSRQTSCTIHLTEIDKKCLTLRHIKRVWWWAVSAIAIAKKILHRERSWSNCGHKFKKNENQIFETSSSFFVFSDFPMGFSWNHSRIQLMLKEHILQHRIHAFVMFFDPTFSKI